MDRDTLRVPVRTWARTLGVGLFVHTTTGRAVLVSHLSSVEACTLSAWPNMHITFGPVRRERPGDAVTVQEPMNFRPGVGHAY